MEKEEKLRRSRERDKRRYASLTLQEKKALYAKNIARRSAKRAAKAIEEGRTPGKRGPKPFTKEEKKAADYAKQMRYRNKDIVAFRAKDAENKKKIRAEKAISEGREVGLIGRKRIYTEAGWIIRRRELAKEKRLKNPEKFRVWSRTDYIRHTDRVKAATAHRRDKVLSVGGKHTAADIAELLKRQKGKCAWCLLSLGESNYHVDHYLPISKGGSNDKGNLRILHARCNLRKSSKHPVDFAQQNGLLCW